MKLLGVWTDGSALNRIKDYDENNPNVRCIDSPNWDGKFRKIFDADGIELQMVVACDLATGECIQHVMEKGADKDAALSLHINNNFEQCLVQSRRVYKTPLREEILEPVEA